jgi:hypothetical protein
MIEPKPIERRDPGCIPRPHFVNPRNFEGPTFPGWGPKLG